MSIRSSDVPVNYLLRSDHWRAIPVRLALNSKGEFIGLGRSTDARFDHFGLDFNKATPATSSRVRYILWNMKHVTTPTTLLRKWASSKHHQPASPDAASWNEKSHATERKLAFLLPEKRQPQRCQNRSLNLNVKTGSEGTARSGTPSPGAPSTGFLEVFPEKPGLGVPVRPVFIR